MQRVAYLDALRGLAAAQVLLLHLATAYFPDLVNSTDTATLSGRIHLSPLFFLYDGYSAVYIFFALSGFVLTRAWISGSPNTAGRWSRWAPPDTRCGRRHSVTCAETVAWPSER